MIVAGAGGHAVEVLDILLEKFQPDEIRFYDDIHDRESIHDEFAVLKNMEEVKNVFKTGNTFCLGVGSPGNRKIMLQKMNAAGGRCVAVVAKNAVVSRYSRLHPSVDIMFNTFVGARVVIGQHTLLNAGALVHHDVVVGEFTEIAPGAILLGGCKIGSECRVGAGAVVLPNIEICDQVILGSGAVIVKSISNPGTYAGVPASKIK